MFGVLPNDASLKDAYKEESNNMVGMIDTCVVLDALQSRQPFLKTSQKIICASACDVFLGVNSVNALTDIFYLLKNTLVAK